MTEEFNLSEKAYRTFNEMFDDGRLCYAEEDVKEFIKLLKEEQALLLIGGATLSNENRQFVLDRIDKLAGKSLVEKKWHQKNN